MSSFIIPDLLSHCAYPLEAHPNGDTVGELSDKWYRSAFPNFSPANEKKLAMLMAGKLCAYIYNDADDNHLQRSCDLMHLILYYGDSTDNLDIQGNKATADLLMNALMFPEDYQPSSSSNTLDEPTISKLSRQFWAQCIPDAALGFRNRFIEDMGLFLEARHIQAIHRKNGIIPGIEEYIDIRRDSSAFKPLFDFLEYTLEIDVPVEIMDHPIVQSLKESANDFCTWANDIYSFNKEQACGDTYNLVALFMREHDLELQEAINTVGDMCFSVLNDFQRYKRQLPSWGQIDSDLSRYIAGLENWMIGCLHWGYMSGRYFGSEGLEIKKTGVVKLWPRRMEYVRELLSLK